MKDKKRIQDNFFEAINQDWIEKTELPSGYPSWGSFEILRKKSIDDIKDLILELANKSKNDLNTQQKMIVSLFNNYLNWEERNKDGLNPLLPMIQDIDLFNDKSMLTNFITSFSKKYNTNFFFKIGIDSDFKDSNLRALFISTMGLGMSDRDFYEESHPRHKEIKNAYKTYVNDLVKESKLKFNTKDVFELIYNFEDKLAKSMYKMEELRSPENIYNVVKVKDLDGYCNLIDWNYYLNETGYSKASLLIVTQPKFLMKLNEILTSISLDDLKDIMKFDILSSFSSMTTEKFYKIAFNFGSVFSGVKEMKPELERAVEFTDNKIGELLGKEYVKKHFSEEAKNDVLDMVHKLIKVYEKRIKSLEWMSDSTKTKAIEKLNNFTIKIGYPDKFENYDGVIINEYKDGGSLFENVNNIINFHVKKELNEINLPVDKTKWYMHPQTVNAYYNPSSNEICFPAAILQAPFYDINVSRARNLGGIGAVIGHEVSHGFDDEGSKFDKDGNFNNWWAEEDYKQYYARTQALVEQYNKYQINGSFVNGKLTLGENIGDLSGVAAALDICKNEAPNDLNQFFENYAIIWRRKSTDELKNTRLLIDPHSPEEFRCNGVLVNIDEFHEVYGTKPDDKMYKKKEERIKIW
ncbi:M13 family metallopeptidase [Spiroplasma turonicum]|uniref:Endopeptidase O n=1 Tax=Spiroplasma turonicum TaxID=216946 RepID=A0A0K1P723_9MOLU|nr:M13 family metallopeptidase [Spiroplasma turonicum]AKU80116.1 endopeptidase O [Spiroplasma turonicum]ALX71116.1 endopeptidase O [Spiroplasma turonicum]